MTEESTQAKLTYFNPRSCDMSDQIKLLFITKKI